MDILVGAARQWGNLEFVALIDRARTVRAASVPELVRLLRTLGIEEQDVRLASPEDGDHAMSLSEHAEFHAAWLAPMASDQP